MVNVAKIQSYAGTGAGNYYFGQILTGEGTWSSVGTLVTGTGTTFKKDFQQGSLFLNVDNQEQRYVSEVVSDTQIVLSSAFASDRSNKAVKRGMPRFNYFEILTAGATIKGVALAPNIRITYDNTGGIEPDWLIHTGDTYLTGLVDL